MQSQEFYMQKCLELACKGMGNVSPNPMVGSVIVCDDEIIGQGYHQEYGFPHAESNAIAKVKNKLLLSKSTLYVNLEPCAHFGKTPPCSDLIIEYKIPKVVIGCVDSFSEVSGRGIENLQNAGLEVVVGVMEKECKEINKRFFTYHEKKRPYIILKWAESKDGFIAPLNQSKPFWMTSTESKKLVHKWRAEEDAILVGSITAKKDNPYLTVREEKGKNPIRVVIDKSLNLGKKLNVFNSESETIIFNEIKSYEKPYNKYIKISFKELVENILEELYKLNIHSIIIEGGARTIQSYIDVNLWDEARVFTTEKKLSNGVSAPKYKGKIKVKMKTGIDNLKIINND